MNIDICPFCKSKDTKYKGLGNFECRTCNRNFTNNYGEIRNYLDKHGRTPVSVICRDTGIPRQIVNQYIKEDKFQLVDVNGKETDNDRVC